MSVQLKREKYEAAKVNLLLRQIQNAAEQGRPMEYEILVDDYVVVPRNSEPQRFNSYADCVGADTRNITIVLYKDGSNGFDKYVFRLDEEPEKKKPEGLGEIPEGLTASEWLEKQKQSWKRELRHDELEKENAELQKELEKKNKALEEYAEKYGKLKEGKLLGYSEIGTSIVLGLLKHPKVQKNFPVLNGFADTQLKEQPEEEAATFSRKGENKQAEPDRVTVELTEEEEGFLMFMRQVQANLTRVQEDNIMRILGQLVKNPMAIGSTLKHLYNFLSSRPGAETNKEEEQA